MAAATIGNAFGSVLASFGRPTIAIGLNAISSVSGAHHRLHAAPAVLKVVSGR